MHISKAQRMCGIAPGDLRLLAAAKALSRWPWDWDGWEQMFEWLVQEGRAERANRSLAVWATPVNGTELEMLYELPEATKEDCR